MSMVQRAGYRALSFAFYPSPPAPLLYALYFPFSPIGHGPGTNPGMNPAVAGKKSGPGFIPVFIQDSIAWIVYRSWAGVKVQCPASFVNTWRSRFSLFADLTVSRRTDS